MFGEMFAPVSVIYITSHTHTSSYLLQKMDPPSPPPERVATSLEHFRQIQREKQAEREAAATPQPNTTADDFSNDPVAQCALVNQMVEAMQNMDEIVDNFVDNPNENDAVRFVLPVPRKDLLEESWELLVSSPVKI